MRLVFHDGEKDISNFTAVLDEVAAEGPIAVAMPYLKPEYLLHLVKDKEWRVLTDLNECLVSMTPNERGQFYQLCRENENKIKHFPLLHAKVVIGRRKAFIGSANLTESGLGRREEVSILLDDGGIVKALLSWFDGLWRRADEPKVEEIKKFCSRPPQNRVIKEEKKYFSTNVSNPKYKITWKQRFKYRQADMPESDRRKHLVETIALAPSEEWIDDYFELIKEAIDITGLTDEDPRIATTCPIEKTIRLNINSRLVLSAFYKDFRSIGFILPRDFKFDNELKGRITKYNPDNPFKPITKNESIETTPIFVAFRVSRSMDLPTYVFKSWKEEVVREVGLRRGSPYKDHHEPLVYKAAVDKKLRKQLIDEAFGGQR